MLAQHLLSEYNGVTYEELAVEIAVGAFFHESSDLQSLVSISQFDHVSNDCLADVQTVLEYCPPRHWGHPRNDKPNSHIYIRYCCQRPKFALTPAPILCLLRLCLEHHRFQHILQGYRTFATGYNPTLICPDYV